MESKKVMTGFLLIAVVLIWSVIIIRVVHGSRQIEPPVVEKLPEKTAVNDLKDSLKLDYRDPFLGKFVRVNQDRKPVRPQVRLVRKEPEQPPVPDFTFKGLIGNASGRRAMIMKNGSLHILGHGDMIGDFKVTGIFPEYVIVQNGRHETKVEVR